MYSYASLDQDGIVVGVQQSTNAIDPLPSNYIAVPDYEPNLMGKRWNGTAFEEGPPPPTVYQQLKQVGFVRLLMQHGGTSQQQILDAKKDTNLEYFWMMFDIASEFERDDPELLEGLTALDTLGYIPNGHQAILENWPTL